MKKRGQSNFPVTHAHRSCYRKIALTPFFLFAASQAAAAFDANGVALGAAEGEIRKQFPSAHCKPLEWSSRAAERRCDDSKIVFGGVQARITFYLKNGAVEAFDVRFAARDLGRLSAFLKSRYGKPASEEAYRLLWKNNRERAELVAPPDKRRGSLLVSRGDFEEEIYRVR